MVCDGSCQLFFCQRLQFVWVPRWASVAAVGSVCFCSQYAAAAVEHCLKGCCCLQMLPPDVNKTLLIVTNEKDLHCTRSNAGYKEGAGRASQVAYACCCFPATLYMRSTVHSAEQYSGWSQHCLQMPMHMQLCMRGPG
ncbi:hypothetical protein COO60DRAFT_1509382 [Scenedesmus sp. NREL 46B-D3]|nr:hypothetical protein COO60DRAFT_1509382 [Scenedesmus sp. NREL 46B-D3]